MKQAADKLLYKWKSLLYCLVYLDWFILYCYRNLSFVLPKKIVVVFVILFELKATFECGVLLKLIIPVLTYAGLGVWGFNLEVWAHCQNIQFEQNWSPLLRRLGSARILILVVILTSNGSELALNGRWDIWKNTTKRKNWYAGSDVFL